MNKIVMKFIQEYHSESIKYFIEDSKYKIIVGDLEVDENTAIEILKNNDCIIDISGMKHTSEVFDMAVIEIPRSITEEMLYNMIKSSSFIRISKNKGEICKVKVSHSKRAVCKIRIAYNEEGLLGMKYREDKDINEEIKHVIRRVLNEQYCIKNIYDMG